MTEFIPTSREVFAERRQRLQRLLAGTGIEAAVIASGLPQPRNFAHNLYYPFRASSHFLYLTGQALEGSIVSIGPAHATLYVDPEDEASALWTGPRRPSRSKNS